MATYFPQPGQIETQNPLRISQNFAQAQQDAFSRSRQNEIDKMAKQQQKFNNKLQIYQLATKTGSSDLFKRLWEQEFPNEDVPEVAFDGGKFKTIVPVEGGGKMQIEGEQEVVSQYYDTLMKNPQMPQQQRAQLAMQMGIQVSKMEEAPEQEQPSLSRLGKLIDERNKTTDPKALQFYDRAIEKEVTRTGQSIEVGADGSIRITEGPVDTPKQTKGTTAADKKFAEEFVKWEASGGYADAQKQIAQLEEAITELRAGGNITGPVIGTIPETVKKFTNPRSIAVREKVEEVVQRNLRQILGAQFTEKEGERLISRAYNENLPESENIQRLNKLITQMKEAARAKQDAAEYFKKNGTISGWKGREYKLEDFTKMDFDRNDAPQAAIQFLKNNPETKEAFKEKYGYLPEGF